MCHEKSDQLFSDQESAAMNEVLCQLYSTQPIHKLDAQQLQLLYMAKSSSMMFKILHLLWYGESCSRTKPF
jgi:hypothetical protein